MLFFSNSNQIAFHYYFDFLFSLSSFFRNGRRKSRSTTTTTNTGNDEFIDEDSDVILINEPEFESEILFGPFYWKKIYFFFEAKKFAFINGETFVTGNLWKLDNDDTQDCLNFLAQIDSDDYENSQQSTEIILMILARFFVDDETSELNSNQTYDYGSIDDDDATQQNFKQVCNFFFFCSINNNDYDNNFGIFVLFCFVC